MRVVFWGTYESQYDRNRILVSGLRAAGVEVVEIHSPVLEKSRFKTDALKSPFKLMSLGFRFIVSYGSLIIRYLRTSNHDIMFVGYLGYLDIFVAWPLAKLRGKPLVFDAFISLYDTVVNDRKIFKQSSLPAWFCRWFDRSACFLADRVLLDTQSHADFFAEIYDLPPDHFLPVWVGADVTYYRGQDKKGPKIPSNRPLRILHYSKFAPLHGIEFMLRAAKELEGDPSIEFWLVGSGQSESDLEELICGLELKNLRRFGWQDPDELAQMIFEADILLGVFGTSGKAARVIPNKVYQSMALGKPIITGDGPGPRELLVHKENAYLCPMGDSKAIADAIGVLKDDEKLRRKLGLGASDSFWSIATPQKIGELLRDDWDENFFALA